MHHDDLVFLGSMLGHDVVAGQPQIDGTGVDLFEDVGGTLEDHLSRAGGQATHAGAVLTRVAAVNSQPTVAQEAEAVVFPTLGRQRDAQRAHTSLRRTVSTRSAWLTRDSSRERMSRTTTAPSARSRSPTITTMSTPTRSA